MKQFYISTNKTCVLDLIWGGTPTSGEVFYDSYLCHGITYILLSFNGKKKRKIGNSLDICVYVNTKIHLKKYSMKIIQMLRKRLP
jgi:hypothetical protein